MACAGQGIDGGKCIANMSGMQMSLTAQSRDFRLTEDIGRTTGSAERAAVQLIH